MCAWSLAWREFVHGLVLAPISFLSFSSTKQYIYISVFRDLDLGKMQTDCIKMLLGYDFIFLGSWNRKLNWLAIVPVLVCLNKLPQVAHLSNL